MWAFVCSTVKAVQNGLSPAIHVYLCTLHCYSLYKILMYKEHDKKCLNCDEQRTTHFWRRVTQGSLWDPHSTESHAVTSFVPRFFLCLRKCSKCALTLWLDIRMCQFGNTSCKSAITFQVCRMFSTHIWKNTT